MITGIEIITRGQRRSAELLGWWTAKIEGVASLAKAGLQKTKYCSKQTEV